MVEIKKHYILDYGEFTYKAESKMKDRLGNEMIRNHWWININDICISTDDEIFVSGIIGKGFDRNNFRNLSISEEKIITFLTMLGIDIAYKNKVLELFEKIKNIVSNKIY